MSSLSCSSAAADGRSGCKNTTKKKAACQSVAAAAPHRPLAARVLTVAIFLRKLLARRRRVGANFEGAALGSPQGLDRGSTSKLTWIVDCNCS